MSLHDSLVLAGRAAPNRLMFGPHETNLGIGRAISERHVAYYRRRAAGGAGIVVCEEASVHESDWPYERSPLASECGAGWSQIAAAVHEHGALAVAALGHAGGQGTSAYSQSPLWAPSRVPEVNSREVPKWMETEDIAAVIDGFRNAAAEAAEAGLDGVEVNAGQYSLVRQFLSGLTNQRSDEWGVDRSRFAREVLASVRRAVGADRIVGLRLSCDELAPWAGLTPEAAAEVAVELAEHIDYLVVVRGSIFTTAATRPDMHTAAGFNIDLCRQVRAALRDAGRDTPVVLQGSVVDPGQAEWALSDGVCDAVEMTRAQIADPALGRKVAAGLTATVRPCVLCNQACGVRDSRNPIVSCIGEPSSGHETDDPAPVADLVESIATPGGDAARVVVIGGGPAGLEAARVAALRGADVRLVERADRLGGAVVAAASGSGREQLTKLTEWLAAECVRLGVEIRLSSEVTVGSDGRPDLDRDDATVVVATGSVAGRRTYETESGAESRVVTALEFLEDPDRFSTDGSVVVFDPIGGPIGVSIAESVAERGRTAHLVTQDNIAGNELARSGDLAPANARLQQKGVAIERRSILRAVRTGKGDSIGVVLEDRFTGDRRTLEAGLLIDAGFRLPSVAEASNDARLRVAGDAVAPRTILEAILEGRRAVADVGVPR